MPSPTDYLKLSAAAYTTGGVPTPPPDLGWKVMTGQNGQPLFSQDASAGFQAVAFQNTSTNEMVIAYQGAQTGASVAMSLGSASADLSLASGSSPTTNNPNDPGCI
jgi:hypothetical protein